MRLGRVVSQENGAGLWQRCRDRLHLFFAVGERRKLAPLWTGDRTGDEITSIGSVSPRGYPNIRKRLLIPVARPCFQNVKNSGRRRYADFVCLEKILVVVDQR